VSVVLSATVFLIGFMVKTMKQLKDGNGKNDQTVAKRLDGHSKKLDDLSTRLAKLEGKTDLILERLK